MCVKVCEGVCVKHLQRLSSFVEQKHSALQVDLSQVLPWYLWKTRIVWIKQMMPRRRALKKNMIHLAKRGKTPTDQQINGSWDNIRPRALTGPKVFGIDENVKSAVFLIAAQTYNELS